MGIRVDYEKGHPLTDKVDVVVNVSTPRIAKLLGTSEQLLTVMSPVAGMTTCLVSQYLSSERVAYTDIIYFIPFSFSLQPIEELRNVASIVEKEEAVKVIAEAACEEEDKKEEICEVKDGNTTTW